MAGKTGILERQKAFDVTTSAQDAIEAKDIPREILVQNSHGSAIVYLNLSGDASMCLAFTSGGTTAIAVGDTIVGESGAATAVVLSITLTSGSWAGGNAAGFLYIDTQVGAFQSETLKVGANLNLATIAADSSARGMFVINPGNSFERTNLRNAVSVLGSAANSLVTVSEGV